MTGDVDAVFTALSDPTRRGLLATIAAHGPVTATELAADLPISRQAVAKHLALLHEAGLLDRRRSGRETLFEARREPLRSVTDWVDSVSRQWDHRLAKLRDHVQGGP